MKAVNGSEIVENARKIDFWRDKIAHFELALDGKKVVDSEVWSSLETFLLELRETGKPLRDWIKESAKIWNEGKYDDSEKFNGIILISRKEVLEELKKIFEVGEDE
jgi:hypothetical protein